MKDITEHIKSSRREGHIEFYIVERSSDRVISRMPVTDGIRNPFGTVQAGALIWFADVSASILILENQTLSAEKKGFPLAIDLHTVLLRNQTEGEVTAEAGFVRKGKKVMVVRTVIKGKEGKLLAEITSTHIPAT